MALCVPSSATLLLTFSCPRAAFFLVASSFDLCRGGHLPLSTNFDELRLLLLRTHPYNSPDLSCKRAYLGFYLRSNLKRWICSLLFQLKCRAHLRIVCAFPWSRVYRWTSRRIHRKLWKRSRWRLERGFLFWLGRCEVDCGKHPVYVTLSHQPGGNQIDHIYRAILCSAYVFFCHRRRQSHFLRGQKLLQTVIRV